MFWGKSGRVLWFESVVGMTDKVRPMAVRSILVTDQGELERGPSLFTGAPQMPV